MYAHVTAGLLCDSLPAFKEARTVALALRGIAHSSGLQGGEFGAPAVSLLLMTPLSSFAATTTTKTSHGYERSAAASSTRLV